MTPQNGGSAINLGTVNRTSAANGLAASNYTLGAANTASIDLDAYAKVGKTGYGGLDIDEGGNGPNLWAVNLNQRTLLKLDVSGGVGSLPGTVRAYELDDLPGVATAAWHAPRGQHPTD